MYQWRSEFANAAVLAIDDAMHRKFGLQPTAHAAKRWVDAALITDGGEAYWAIPHVNVSGASLFCNQRANAVHIYRSTMRMANCSRRMSSRHSLFI